MRFAIGLEYSGSEFKGWQRQRGERTVQAAVEAALSRVADQPVSVVTAGRTDTGVHASAQVAHFDTGAERSRYAWLRGANSFLPPDVSLLWVSDVPGDFHARFSALSRSYRYVIINRRVRSALHRGLAAWDYRPLDAVRMQKAANLLVGEHDFSGFRAAGCQAKSAIRVVHEFLVRRDGEWIVLDVRANAFLQHMVRNMAGVLMAIGAGVEDVGWAKEVLDSRDRRLGGVAAPAAGLYLTAVTYPPSYRLPDPPARPRFW